MTATIEPKAAAPSTGGTPSKAGAPSTGGTPSKAGAPSKAVAAGGLILGLSVMVATAGNYLLNILLGRWLSPAEFSDATLMVTLMLTLSSLALCLQLVTARFVGIQPRGAGTARLVVRLRWWSWSLGTAVGAIMAALAIRWQMLFHTSSAWPFVILGAAIPFYLAQAVSRGVLQGQLRFGRLSASLIIEMVVRVGIGAGLVAAGAGVVGATVGLAASLIATWLFVRGQGTIAAGEHTPTPAGVGAYLGSVAVLLAAQVIITNSDVLIAKTYLVPATAGAYAAVALMGRAVFFLSWAAATVVFPAVARRHADGGDTRALLVGGIAAVTGLGMVCTIGALVAGGPILGALIGPAYAHLSGPLALYALLTTVFAIANLFATHHLSTGRVRESWLMLCGAAVQTTALLVWHDTIARLIQAQLAAVAVLLIAVLTSHFMTTKHHPSKNLRRTF